MTEYGNFPTISSRELYDIPEENRPVILDVLPPEHFEQKRIAGAVNACVYEVIFPDTIASLALDKNRTVVAYGMSGRTLEAQAAAEKLTRMGFGDIRLLEHGLEGWMKEGLPLEGAAAKESVQDFHHSPLAEGSFDADTEESIIRWAGRNHNGMHYGTISLESGGLAHNDGHLHGNFIVDMKSIVNEDLTDGELNQLLLAHLASDDFFFAERFPDAEYTIIHASRLEDVFPGQSNFEIDGELELRGIRGPVNFPATVTNHPEGGLVAEAHFDFDRTKFGALYGSGRLFAHLGMHLVFDLVSISLRIVAR